MCWEPIDGANIPFVEVVYRWRNSKITAAHYFFGVNGSPLIPWCKFMEIPKLPIFDKTRWCVVGQLMQLPWLQHCPVQKKFGAILKLPPDPPDPEWHLLGPRTLKSPMPAREAWRFPAASWPLSASIAKVGVVKAHEIKHTYWQISEAENARTVPSMPRNLATLPDWTLPGGVHELGMPLAGQEAMAAPQRWWWAESPAMLENKMGQNKELDKKA